MSNAKILSRRATIFALSSLLIATPMAQAAVGLTQSPLIIQKPIPPNLVLMLDDSGSMDWDFMPDYSYLKNNSNNDALINSNNNGVYYNPAITYKPPKKIDGTNYQDQTDFTQTPLDGFGTKSTIKINLTDYDGSQDTKIIKYSAKTSSSKTFNNISSESDCAKILKNTSGSSYNYSKNKKTCEVNYSINAFQYSLGPKAGPYDVRYVANTNCGGLSNCVLASDTSGTAAPPGIAAGNNIANWFAYYHTRILTAKTALTLAFLSLNPNYRLGFGSINGNNNSKLPQSKYSYYDSYNNKTNYIAQVQAFGDGTAGTQKVNFWNWITSESANGGTPLRQALDQVGKYYQTSQPWLTGGNGPDANQSYACRPAFTILTTDGFWNENFSGPGNTDGSAGPAITSPANYQYQPSQPFQDPWSNTLADVAMKYWQTDLQPNIDNQVPTTPNDPAFWQHMVTFTMGLGFDPDYIEPNLTQYQIFSWARTGTPPSGVTSLSWPEPKANDIRNIADLLHAAVNGHGDFFSVKNPTDFINGLKSALAQIADRKGAGNAITLSGNSTTSTADAVYRFIGSYFTGQWTGALTAEKWDANAQAYVPAWSVNSAFPAPEKRNIWTLNRIADTQNSQNPTQFILGVGNTLPALDESLKQALDYYVNGAQQSISQAEILNYLRGDNSNSTLRQRKAALGDVISSTPVYVAAPEKTLYVNATFDGASSYGTFVANKATRTPLVYVAANDGMLHAFRVKQGTTNGQLDADKPAGQEVFAYLPAGVLAQKANSQGGISNLANPQYGVVDGVTGAQAVPHQYYNDGRITTQNVYLDTGDGQGKIWRTILVGTTGRGPAKTVYALDITNPDNFDDPSKSAKNILWERSAGDNGACTGVIAAACSKYIGQITGAPVIAQIKNGTGSKWVVYLGNGYNSEANVPALLEFDLATGALNVRPTTGSINDGLAEPGIAQPDSKTGISTAAYAGDLNGNLWSFDLQMPTGTGAQIFQAKDANDKPQPITSLVALSYDATKNKESTWAFFGTGRYLDDSDVSDTQIQTWYGLRVARDTTNLAAPIVSTTTTRADLRQRSIVKEDAAGDGKLLRATSAAAANDLDNKPGWYMDLSTQSGERIINRTQFIGGMALVTTLIPKVSDPCNTVPSGSVMLVSPFTGANVSNDFGLGATTYKNNNVTINVAYNGVVYPVGPAGGVTGNYDKNGKIVLQFNNLSGSPVNLGPITSPAGNVGRVSWRELSF